MTVKLEVNKKDSSSKDEKKNSLQVAQEYLEMGFKPIPVPSRQKNPNLENWQNLLLDSNSLPKHFQFGKQNIGVLLGDKSGWLVDIDLDVPEAVAIAPVYLPKTLTFGRDSNPASHWLYKSDGAVTKKFKDIDGEMIIELRSTGSQTIFPGSVHPDGEEIRFDNSGQNVMSVPKEELLRYVVQIAISSLLARHWPKEGSRQELALALAGGFLGTGLPAEDTSKIITTAAKVAGDDEVRIRELVVECTQKKLEDGDPITGWPTVKTIIDEGVIKKIHEWLSLVGFSTQGEAESSGDKEEITISESIAKKLIAIGEEAFLFHDEKGDPFAQIKVKGTKRVVSIKGDLFSKYLVREYYDRTGKAPNNNAITSAITVLKGKAELDGPRIPLHVRFHVSGEEIWIDMADDLNRALKVTKEKWEIVNDPPIMFRRYKNQMALPEPDLNGDPAKVLEFLNLKNKSDELLILVWMIAAPLASIPRPLLCLTGPQGAAKTTAARIIRDPLDPTVTETLYLPHDLNELAQILEHYAVPLFDNLSSLSQNQANLFCMGVTGGAYLRRELFTNSEDHVLRFRRAILMTGINVPPTTSDLLDRSQIVELERIKPESRLPECEMWCRYENAKGAILGGILNTLVRALKIKPATKVTQYHRLADFTVWGAAIAKALGYNQQEFLDALFSNMNRQLQEILDNPLADGILKVVKESKSWKGSPTELLEKLNDEYKDTRTPQNWPRQANVMSRKLKELQSHLAEAGVTITWSDGRSKGRVIEIKYEEPKSPSPSDHPIPNQGRVQDGQGNGSSRVKPKEFLEKDDKDGQDGSCGPSNTNQPYRANGKAIPSEIGMVTHLATDSVPR